MGNARSKDPQEVELEKAKRAAAKRRRTKLKKKRRSTMREWDPSGTGDQGPQVGVDVDLEGADEGIQQGESGWKVEKTKRASMAKPKEWDPSGTDQGDRIMGDEEAGHDLTWKAAIDLSADMGAKEKLKRRSKRPSARASTAGGSGLSVLKEDAEGEGGGQRGRARDGKAEDPHAPLARLSLVQGKRASATVGGVGVGQGSLGTGSGSSLASVVEDTPPSPGGNLPPPPLPPGGLPPRVAQSALAGAAAAGSIVRTVEPQAEKRVSVHGSSQKRQSQAHAAMV